MRTSLSWNESLEEDYESSGKGLLVRYGGHLRSGRVGRGGAELCVSQTEKLPMMDYRDGAAKDGVMCRAWYERQTGNYFAKVNGLENISREIRLILPSVRTKKKLQQVARFKEYLCQKRARHQQVAERALKVLEGDWPLKVPKSRHKSQLAC